MIALADTRANEPANPGGIVDADVDLHLAVVILCGQSFQEALHQAAIFCRKVAGKVKMTAIRPGSLATTLPFADPWNPAKLHCCFVFIIDP